MQISFLKTLTVLLLYFTGIPAQNLHWQLDWQRVNHRSDAEPPTRRGSSLARTHTALYLFGGENSDGVLGDMWKFSLFTNEWEELQLIKKPAARHGHVSGAFEDYWYITHGKGSNKYFDDTWVFDFNTEKWTEMNMTESEIPEPRCLAAGGGVTDNDDDDELLLDDIDGDVMMVWMSTGVNRVGRKLSDTWILTINQSDPFLGKWDKVSNGVGLNQYNPHLPHARSHAAGMPFTNGRFILNGGCSSGGQVGGPCPLEDTWVFYSSNSTWSRLSACPIPVHSSSMVTLNSHILDVGVIYGGRQDGQGLLSQVLGSSSLSANEVTLINITSLEWTRIQVNGSGDVPTARSNPHMVPAANGIYMFGGESTEGNGVYLNDLWFLETTGGGTPQYLSCSYTWFSFLHLHGILMYLAWGLLLPFGAMMGRYYRWSWPVWFAIHVGCQVFGTILTVGGFIVVFLVAKEPSHPHGVIGIILMFSVTQQFLSGIIRPWLGKEDGKYVDDCQKRDTFKYRWRRCWEVYHRVSGVISIGLGFIQVTLGVFLINAPVPVWGVWLALMCIWLLVFLFHEIIHFSCVRLHKE